MEQTPKEVGPPLVADSPVAAAQEPGLGAFDHPPVAPKRSLESMPCHAIRGVMPRARRARCRV